MAEYIKRSAVFEQFDNADADVCETDDFGGVDYGFGMKNIKELINAIPAADVVEVVRCKDCYQSVVIGDVLHCTYWGKNTDENGYCHEGG
jgi:hypothetical protein